MDPEKKSNKTEQGIVFPLDKYHKRSSTLVAKKILSASVADFDPNLSNSILREKKWRKNYLKYINRINIAGIKSGENTLITAQRGLEAAYRNMTFIRNDQEMSIDTAMKKFDSPLFHSVKIEGGQESENREFNLPYNNKILSKDHLLNQINEWQTQGIFEPSFGNALRKLISHKEWLDLSGITFVIMGAGSEISPLKTLLSFGATVIAIDLERPDIWKNLIEFTRTTSGSLIFPIKAPVNLKLNDDGLATMAGANLTSQTPEIRTWLKNMDTTFTIGAYAYADGAKFIKLAMAMDAIIKDLTQTNKNHTIAFLLTPTDSFAVPMEVVNESIRKQKRNYFSYLLFGLFNFISMGTQFVRHNDQIITNNNKRYGLSDNMISQQGPGYIMAKNIQKWRCLVSLKENIHVSGNVAPATTTRSVFKNKLIATGYAGLAFFKAEAFKSETTAGMMAAALIHDLNNKPSIENSTNKYEHPLEFFMITANHGGLWRIAYKPRTVLAFSVLLGVIKALKEKIRPKSSLVAAKNQKENVA